MRTCLSCLLFLLSIAAVAQQQALVKIGKSPLKYNAFANAEAVKAFIRSPYNFSEYGSDSPSRRQASLALVAKLVKKKQIALLKEGQLVSYLGTYVISADKGDHWHIGKLPSYEKDGFSYCRVRVEKGPMKGRELYVIASSVVHPGIK